MSLSVNLVSKSSEYSYVHDCILNDLHGERTILITKTVMDEKNEKTKIDYMIKIVKILRKTSQCSIDRYLLLTTKKVNKKINL